MGWDAGAVRTGSGAVRRKMRTTALSADSVRCEETVGMQEVGPPPRSACRPERMGAMADRIGRE